MRAEFMVRARPEAMSRALAERGWSVVDLARHAGLAPGTARKLTRGQPVRPGVLHRAVRALLAVAAEPLAGELVA